MKYQTNPGKSPPEKKHEKSKTNRREIQQNPGKYKDNENLKKKQIKAKTQNERKK